MIREENQKCENKIRFSTEMAYVIGLIILALSTSMMERAGLGMSMVVAPAYLVHRWLSPMFSFVTFGAAEYIFQGVLLVLMIAVVRRFRVSYLFSFATAVLYGVILDAFIWVIGWIPTEVASLMPVRLALYGFGMLFCALAVALMFRTYLSPEVYELFVKEFADRYHKKISVVKTVYDCISCLVAVVISFAVFGFGRFVGVQWGTIVCALINGWIIGCWSKMFDQKFIFTDACPALRRWFEK